jgi:hypothetical protein
MEADISCRRDKLLSAVSSRLVLPRAVSGRAQIGDGGLDLMVRVTSAVIDLLL